MLGRLHEKTGTAGLILAVAALVAALAGGAYAASGLNGKQKKEVKSIAKSYQGKGDKGDKGDTGAKGDTGSKGDTGAKGDKGAQGDPGSPGAPGKSVVVTPIAPAGAKCEGFGGAEVKVEGAVSVTNVCNGAPGEPGPKGDKGDPWTPESKLPSGATETGVWGLSATAAGTPKLFGFLPLQIVPMSFTVRLPTKPTAHFVKLGEEAPADCTVESVKGTFANPLAKSGHLCVYVGSNPTENEEEEPNLAVPSISIQTIGAIMSFEVTEDTIANGSWAVTG